MQSTHVLKSWEELDIVNSSNICHNKFPIRKSTILLLILQKHVGKKMKQYGVGGSRRRRENTKFSKYSIPFSEYTFWNGCLNFHHAELKMTEITRSCHRVFFSWKADDSQNSQKYKWENKYNNCWRRWWLTEKKKIGHHTWHITYRAVRSLVKIHKICLTFLPFIWERCGRVLWAVISITGWGKTA